MKFRTLALLCALALPVGACGTASEFIANLSFVKSDRARTPLPQDFMVASAHPHATAAGLEVLRKGGSAVDAAIAVQLVLTLVEPESSGIGGGAFMLTFDPATGDIEALDGRETAPASVTPALHLDENGKPLKFFDKVLGGKSVGVPGVVAMLEMAHDDHGKLPWEDLFPYAIDLADDGFEMSPKLHEWLIRLPSINEMPDMRAYFTDNGVPHGVGTIIKNPEYAATLRKIASGKSDAFYKATLPRRLSSRPGRPETPGDHYSG